MAFSISSLDPTHVENVGTQHRFDLYTGVVALSGGSATVTIPGVKHVVYASASSQTSNAARISATATNTFTITGTGSDVAMWIALVQR